MTQWAEAFTEYFRQGIKRVPRPWLGVEIEHFILRLDTGVAVPYVGPGGVREILRTLLDCYPEAEALPGEDLFGFSGPEFVITLEPAAQLEISIAATESVAHIGEVYNGFLRNLRKVLASWSYNAFTVGCQPVSRVEDLTLIPKERYRLMDNHFARTGSGGREMMRGTASVQVSIDYFSEDDFRRKMQAAYYYSPVLKLLADHATAFEGKPLTGFLKRTDIWNRVDSARCGIVPDVFKADFGFADYAAFLGKMPPIFLPAGGENRYTGFQTVEELYREDSLDEESLVHILSMAFPDVRLKRYLELRMADSMPEAFMLAYSALIKGALYSREGLDFAQESIRAGRLTEQDIQAAESDLMARGWEAEIYGRPARETALTLLALAERNLPVEERAFLDPLHQVVRYGGIARIPVMGGQHEDDC